MNRANAYLKLLRLPNAVIAATGVGLGYSSLGAPRPPWAWAAWGGLSMLLLTAAGNADNDVCDVKTDRVNRPDRPLPSGLITVPQARWMATLLYLAGMFAAAQATPAHGVLAGVMVLALIAYNRLFKGLPLIGNLTVSLLCALAIYFPEFPGLPQATLPACVFAFLATFAREVVKDWEDCEGDRVAGLRTFPLVAGPIPTRRLALALVATLLVLLPIPMMVWHYHWLYALVAATLLLPLLLLLLRELNKSVPDLRGSQQRLKWVMLAGMVALLAGRL